MILVSRNIKYMRIFAGVPRGGASIVKRRTVKSHTLDVRLTHFRSISRSHAYGWNLTHSHHTRNFTSSADEGNQNFFIFAITRCVSCAQNVTEMRWRAVRSAINRPIAITVS